MSVGAGSKKFIKTVTFFVNEQIIQTCSSCGALPHLPGFFRKLNLVRGKSCDVASLMYLCIDVSLDVSV